MSHLADSNRGPFPYEGTALPAELRWHVNLYVERVTGVEPVTQPWEGRVLPLNYTRKKTAASTGKPVYLDSAVAIKTP